MLQLLLLSAALSVSPREELNTLFDVDWEFVMKTEPTWASSLGDRRYNDKWPDVSFAALAARDKHNEGMLASLQKIDRGALEEKDQLNYDVFKDVIETRRGLYKHKLWLLPLDQMGGVHTQDQLIDDLRFETKKDRDDWLARMRSYPALVDQHIALMKRGLEEKILPPKIVLSRVPGQIDRAIVDDATASSFYAPFKEGSDKRQQDEAKKIIRTGIVPALKKLRAFVVDEYLPACPEDVGVSARPGGKDVYAFLVRMHTTTTRSPDEIHAIGLKEVERIRGEMLKVMKQLNFKGSLAELFQYLRTDPKLYPKSSEEILEKTRALAKKIDGRLPKVLGTMPRMPYGVEPVPSAIAPEQTTAYYSGPAEDGSRSGTYFVNTYKPEARPLWEMVPLALHEAVPGHHTQIALAMERKDQPAFRRHAAPYTAFVEGWGLYAESLGEEMDLYDDPYDRLGQLTYEMWRAVRLVVDTGIHHKGWTRKQAIDFFLANAPKTELDVTNEVDRYIVWPGQALAYKTGQLTLKELRARAEKKLGAKFSLPAFHDAVLLEGALPLSVLEKRIDNWVEQQARATAKR